MTRTDKRSHINDLANQAEDVTSRGEQGRVYKITKLVYGRYRGGKNAPIRSWTSRGDYSRQKPSKTHDRRNTSVKF